MYIVTHIVRGEESRGTTHDLATDWWGQDGHDGLHDSTDGQQGVHRHGSVELQMLNMNIQKRVSWPTYN